MTAGVLRSQILHAIYGIAGLGLLALLLVNGLLQVQQNGDWDTLGDATFFLFLIWLLAGALLIAIKAGGLRNSHDVATEVSGP